MRVLTPDKLRFFRIPSAGPLHRWLFALSLAICGGDCPIVAKQLVRDDAGAQSMLDAGVSNMFDSTGVLFDSNLANRRDARNRAGAIAVAQNKLGSPPLNETVALDIPAQSLESALYAFGAATGTEIFADGSAVTGRRSNDVKGVLTVAQALRVLLTDTGLEAHTIGAHAITLSLIPQERSKTAFYRSFSAYLQNAALRQLCREEDIDLGTYRIAMQLWFNDLGGVRRVELLSSTGDQARDRRIQSLLQGISVGKPPPRLPQPVVMVILPRSFQDSGDCTIGAVKSSQSDGRDHRDSAR
jgi:hypothetical protein